MRRAVKRGLIAAGTLALLGVLAIALVWNGVILLNNPGRERYPVRGVDVSNWQGEIDWPTLAAQDIGFAFIKATEGSDFVDRRFAENWSGAQQTGLRTGVYHFFSFDSPGHTQAENFIRTVKPFEGMLPPVIDVEFYGDKAKNPPAREDVCRELDDMVALLKAHYGMQPILYATRESYDLYLAGAYADCDIWFRSVLSRPRISDGRTWTFWQYTNRERLQGYSGEENFIDMNVFCGGADEFLRYGE